MFVLAWKFLARVLTVPSGLRVQAVSRGFCSYFGIADMLTVPMFRVVAFPVAMLFLLKLQDNNGCAA